VTHAEQHHKGVWRMVSTLDGMSDENIFATLGLKGILFSHSCRESIHVIRQSKCIKRLISALAQCPAPNTVMRQGLMLNASK